MKEELINGKNGVKHVSHNPFTPFFGGKSSPVRLYPKQSFREKYEAELILCAGAMVIILLFLFAFLVVGPMNPYTNGGLI